MKIDNETKRRIARDWVKEFPSLSAYSQNKLYKVVGPVIIGMEIFKLPRKDDYRPYFVCYPLWKADVKGCLDEPLVLQEIYTGSGFQFNIPYLKHETYFSEAVDCTKKQLLIPFDRDVKVNELFKMIEKQYDDILVKASPVMQAKLCEFKFCAAVYVGDERVTREIVKEIQKIGKLWQPELFEWKYGSFVMWLQNLREKESHRSDFLAKIRLNINDKKIAQLKRSELIL